MSLVQWRLRQLQNRPSQCLLWARLCLETSAIWFQLCIFWGGMCPSKKQSGLSCCLFALPESPLFALDFVQLPGWNRLELLPILVHGSLCIRNLHRLWHWDKLTHQITMCHRSESFPSNPIFMCFGLQRFCSLSRRLVGFHHTTIHCFEFFLMAIFLLNIRFHDAGMLFVSLAGHGRSNKSLHFLLAFFLIISEHSLSSGSIE